MPKPSPSPAPETGLNSVEAEFVGFFVHLATALGMPRSVGEIFGFLFAADSPRAFDEVVARLGISKGSASQGLRFLTKIGAVSQVYKPRDRRTFYEAETRIRQLFGNALRESVRPHLEGNSRLVASLEASIAEASDTLGDAATEHYRNRAASLRGWNEKASQLPPLLEKLFSLPAPLPSFKLFEPDIPPESAPPHA